MISNEIAKEGKIKRLYLSAEQVESITLQLAVSSHIKIYLDLNKGNQLVALSRAGKKLKGIELDMISSKADEYIESIKG